MKFQMEREEDLLSPVHLQTLIMILILFSYHRPNAIFYRPTVHSITVPTNLKGLKANCGLGSGKATCPLFIFMIVAQLC